MTGKKGLSGYGSPLRLLAAAFVRVAGMQSTQPGCGLNS